MNVTVLGLLALALPVLLVAGLFALHRVAELTRVSQTARWAIAIPAAVASAGFALWDLSRGGSAWVQLITTAVWVFFISVDRRDKAESAGAELSPEVAAAGSNSTERQSESRA